MNFNDFQQIYQEMINTYKRDPSITDFQINIKIKNIITEKKTAVINADIRSIKNEVKFKN